MAIVNDFLVDDNNDLVFIEGDFAVGESDSTHIKDIVYSYPGFWKQFPLVGVGIQSYLNSSGEQQKLKNSINEQLNIDGYKTNSIVINDDATINIDSERL